MHRSQRVSDALSVLEMWKASARQSMNFHIISQLVWIIDPCCIIRRFCGMMSVFFLFASRKHLLLGYTDCLWSALNKFVANFVFKAMWLRIPNLMPLANFFLFSRNDSWLNNRCGSDLDIIVCLQYYQSLSLKWSRWKGTLWVWPCLIRIPLSTHSTPSTEG